MHGGQKKPRQHQAGSLHGASIIPVAHVPRRSFRAWPSMGLLSSRQHTIWACVLHELDVYTPRYIVLGPVGT